MEVEDEDGSLPGSYSEITSNTSRAKLGWIKLFSVKPEQNEMEGYLLIKGFVKCVILVHNHKLYTFQKKIHAQVFLFLKCF